MAGVILKNITKRFNDVTAVNDLSIQIQDKAFAVLVGPSGCGCYDLLQGFWRALKERPLTCRI